MQEIDIRYALFLIPLIYVIVPYLLTGSFIVLGGVTVLAFLSAVIVLVIITNLHLGGRIDAVIGTGGGVNIGLNDEAGYSLFVIFVGGLFYLGAQIATFVTSILSFILGILNAIFGFIGWIFGVNTSTLSTSIVSSVGNVASPRLSEVYPLGLTILGISVFGALDVIMGSLFILGLYFMVASRGH